MWGLGAGAQAGTAHHPSAPDPRLQGPAQHPPSLGEDSERLLMEWALLPSLRPAASLCGLGLCFLRPSVYPKRGTVMVTAGCKLVGSLPESQPQWPVSSLATRREEAGPGLVLRGQMALQGGQVGCPATVGGPGGARSPLGSCGSAWSSGAAGPQAGPRWPPAYPPPAAGSAGRVWGRGHWTWPGWWWSAT